MFRNHLNLRFMNFRLEIEDVSREQKNYITAAFYLFAGLAYAILPLFTIAALNTLFPLLNIAYTFGTWVSMFFLIVLVMNVFGRENA